MQVSQDLRKCLVIDAPKISLETIITNDVVEVISETEFIWKGRLDNVINSGGFKLHPEEIEQKLFSAIASRFFVAGMANQILGERLILVIEAEAYQLDDEVFSELLKFEIPKEVYFLPKFIETETGKIQRLQTLTLVS